MTQAKVIIGSAFGDEGKGLFTDYLSSKSEGKTCVVRFNGGAQAGHSVELADGRRHVFSHFGSGTYAGLPTYLSSFFVCNPIIFLREYAQLAADGVQPKTYLDPSCPVTTPYDIMINQIIEQARGADRHGSVGVGFGETLERHGHAEFSLTVGELEQTDILRLKLDDIRARWLPQRLAKFGITSIPPEWMDRFADDAIREKFIEDCAHFLACTTRTPLISLLRHDALIFEGAQGLLLDQDYGYFPHVTRSNTGLKNVVNLVVQLDLEALDVYYLTRTYLTRHGAGPLPHELSEQPYAGITDKTNKPNPYQGSLRFAWFNLDLFRQTVHHDLMSQDTSIDICPHLAMSCMDQVDGMAHFIENDAVQTGSPAAMMEKARRSFDAVSALTSYGPTRQTILEVGRSAKPRRSSFGRGYEFTQPLGVAEDNKVAALA